MSNSSDESPAIEDTTIPCIKELEQEDRDRETEKDLDGCSPLTPTGRSGVQIQHSLLHHIEEPGRVLQLSTYI